MRILLITAIFPPDIGGPATYVPRIASALAERGHAITVVTHADLPFDPSAHYLFPVVRLARSIFRPLRLLRTIATVLRYGHSADVLYVNGLAFEAALANLLLRKPMVLKVVGDLAWERSAVWGWISDSFDTFQARRYGPKVEALRALRTWWSRRADKVIAPSRYLASAVARWGIPHDRIAVVYNAVEPVDHVKGSDGPLSSTLNLVSVGRLVPWKAIDRLTVVVAHLDDVSLLVIGDGPERARLKAAAEALGVSGRIRFVGHKTRTETLAMMANCDVFVLNSTYEGLPHVVLEAMSLGLPVVATAVGGTPEVVHDRENGRLVLPGDDEALRDVLSDLHRDRSERQRLATGARLTSRQFDAVRMVEETEAALLVVAQKETSDS